MASPEVNSKQFVWGNLNSAVTIVCACNSIFILGTDTIHWYE